MAGTVLEDFSERLEIEEQIKKENAKDVIDANKGEKDEKQPPLVTIHTPVASEKSRDYSQVIIVLALTCILILSTVALVYAIKHTNG